MKNGWYVIISEMVRIERQKVKRVVLHVHDYKSWIDLTTLAPLRYPFSSPDLDCI